MSDAGAMAMPLVAGDRSRSARRLSGLLVVALICASVASLTSGASDTSLGQVMRDLLAGQGIGARDRIVLVEALRRTRRLDRRTELLRLLNDDGEGDVQPASSATVSHLPARAGHGHRQRRLPC
ncbi:MAG TPA: hypothetical protein PLI13_14170 [Paracoccus sp. (in: a-proteobacteria)]|nr:hypothetical protein [Paracoccus sp. (in: a-proteobacteria)]